VVSVQKLKIAFRVREDECMEMSIDLSVKFHCPSASIGMGPDNCSGEFEGFIWRFVSMSHWNIAKRVVRTSNDVSVAIIGNSSLILSGYPDGVL